MSPLTPWMRWLLRFVAGYNVLAGFTMLVFCHECYKVVGVPKPALSLPLQLVGVLVGLFGVGYWLVSREPVENRHLLMLGFWSKALGSALGVYYTAAGKLPLVFLAILFFADIIYLPPFAVILRRLYRLAAERRGDALPAAHLSVPHGLGNSRPSARKNSKV